MKDLATISIALLCGWLSLSAQEPDAVETAGAPRFVVIEVQVDSGAEPLAAYQLEFFSTNGAVRIIGIEGGEHPAFKQPPYYDPVAIQQDRVVLGAFSTAAVGQLPSGLVRVASIHLMVTGNVQPGFNASIEAAATFDGRPVPVQISIKERGEK